MNPSNSCTSEAAITPPSEPCREVLYPPEQLCYENKILCEKSGMSHCTNASLKIRKIRVMLSYDKEVRNLNAAG